MAPAPAKERIPSDTENLTGMPSPDSIANSPSLKPSLSNGHCKQETTFTFPIEGDQKGVPEVQTWNPLSGRTRMERRLLIVAAVLAACSLTVIVVLFLQWRPEENALYVRRDGRKQRSNNDGGDMESKAAAQAGKQCEPVCTTPSCVASAARLLSNMDDSVDPCEDFFEYSCGGWHRANIIPEDAARYAIPLQLIKRLEIQCKDIIERTPSPSEAVAITKARHFYKACMDEAVLDERENEPLRALISQLGGWPVMGDGVFDDTTWNLVDVLARSRMKIDRNFIFRNRISVDAKNSTVYIIALDQPELGLESRDYFLQNDTYEQGLIAYENYMTQMALDLRSDGDEEEVRRQMRDVLKFEKKLANISISVSERRRAHSMYHKITIVQLKAAVPVVDWVRYFRYVINTTHLDESMEVVLYSPRYLLGLNEILAVTPRRTLANYIIWRSVMHTIDQLSSKARAIRQVFQKVVSGEQKQPARWKQCIDSTNHFMGLALGALFVQEHFDEQSKQTAYEMINYLRGSLYTILNSTEWMDDETKQNALEKAYAIRERIGYDERLLNQTYLNSRYTNIDVHRDTYYENALEIWRDHATKSFAKLQERVDRYSWTTTPVVVNAYYQFTSNQIIFPAAILQPPYFSRQYSRSMNYGGIGVVIGHELMHGFDDRGRLFDKDGNMQYWWSESSSESFKAKAQCLVGQYSNYTFEDVGLSVNGVQTLGENIADNGGLKEAFMAYRHSVEHGQGEELLLPGVNLTHNQIFFLSFGQLWCGLLRDQDKMNSIKSDFHSPLKFRVWGTVSNSKEFAEAFNCPAGSPMNPRKKCAVW